MGGILSQHITVERFFITDEGISFQIWQCLPKQQHNNPTHTLQTVLEAFLELPEEEQFQNKLVSPSVHQKDTATSKGVHSGYTL